MKHNQVTDYPMVSIIALNYNQLGVTLEFLESTKSLTYPNYEIILVDNNSNEDPTEIISEKFPEVKLIVTDKNLGFTGGNNVGIAAANGDYYFIVNNDTEVTPDLLERLLEPFEEDPNIGMVSPKIRYHVEPEVIQYAGFNKINPFTGRNSTVGQKEKDTGQYDKSGYTHYAHGAAMMVPREVVNKVGPLPDIFFIYYEELDWSAHIIRAGYQIYYQSKALIFHKESITVGKDSPFKAYYHNRNRILFMRRNTTKAQFIYFLFFLVFMVVPKNIIVYTLNGQFVHLKSFFRALAWNMNNPKYTKAY
ncbi:MAG: glycosyltransferase family 2 protein [Marinoscillum sp.]